MKRISLSRFVSLAGLLFVFVMYCKADTALYNDGVWIVSGVDSADPSLRRISVSVDGQPAGRFTELAIQRSFAGGYPLICSIQARGGVQMTVPPSGAMGGTFYLTRYSDCYLGEQLVLGIASLNIQSNTKNFKSLTFNGSLSNGTSLHATDLKIKLDLPNNSTVRMDVRYTLYATANVCVDQWQQQTGEGFQVARIGSNFISDQIMYNDGFRMKGFLGPYCDCCDCYYEKGSICANFTNGDGYVLPYFAWMANAKLDMLHWQIGPLNTPALRITTKSPARSKCSVQGYTALSIDPSADNVNLWINWSQPNTQYTPGQKVLSCHFKFEALLPDGTSCDLIVP